MAAFPVILAGRPPHHSFRGLLGVHSRYGLHHSLNRLNGPLTSECFDIFVLVAPTATGWSDPLPGGTSLPLKTTAFSRRTEKCGLVPPHPQAAEPFLFRFDDGLAEVVRPSRAEDQADHDGLAADLENARHGRPGRALAAGAGQSGVVEEQWANPRALTWLGQRRTSGWCKAITLSRPGTIASINGEAGRRAAIRAPGRPAPPRSPPAARADCRTRARAAPPADRHRRAWRSPRPSSASARSPAASAPQHPPHDPQHNDDRGTGRTYTKQSPRRRKQVLSCPAGIRHSGYLMDGCQACKHGVCPHFGPSLAGELVRRFVPQPPTTTRRTSSPAKRGEKCVSVASWRRDLRAT